MIGVAVPVIAGAMAGGGIALVVQGLVPVRPELAAALRYLHAPVNPQARAPRPSDWRGEVGQWLDERAPARWLRIPDRDLAILGWTRQRLWLQKLTAVLVGLALPTLLFTTFAIARIHFDVAVPVAVTLLIAAGMSLLPELAARSQASERRADFRRSVGAYFDLVALERAAEGGAVDALTRAATVGRGWAFRRLAETLTAARLTGVPPWTALARLADELGVAELTDLADVIALAGADGAAVFDTLLAKARSIRAATLAATEAQANARSEAMTLPAALLGIGFVLLVGYPALSRILTG